MMFETVALNEEKMSSVLWLGYLWITSLVKEIGTTDIQIYRITI